eukprot:2276866-Pleurochrysis_carterae.AAC.2
MHANTRSEKTRGAHAAKKHAHARPCRPSSLRASTRETSRSHGWRAPRTLQGRRRGETGSCGAKQETRGRIDEAWPNSRSRAQEDEGAVVLLKSKRDQATGSVCKAAKGASWRQPRAQGRGRTRRWPRTYDARMRACVRASVAACVKKRVYE